MMPKIIDKTMLYDFVKYTIVPIRIRGRAIFKISFSIPVLYSWLLTINNMGSVTIIEEVTRINELATIPKTGNKIRFNAALATMLVRSSRLTYLPL